MFPQVNTLKLSALTLSDTLHAPGSRIPDHVHDVASICLTLAGQGFEIIDGARVSTLPGGVIMRGANIRHSDHYGVFKQHTGFTPAEFRTFANGAH